MSRYVPMNEKSFVRSEFWHRLSAKQQRVFSVVTKVLPFRVNEYVLNELINWHDLDNDPIYQLVFPQAGMLSKKDFTAVEQCLENDDLQHLKEVVHTIRLSMNPHPAGQLDANQPCLNDGTPLNGVQHKYRETLLFFPAAAQTCHAYCSFCFRWPQFVDMPGYKFQAKESQQLVTYLQENPDVSDVLFTGGDPMVMNVRSLVNYIEPLLNVASVKTIRIGTKSLSYWPYRYLTDKDSDDVIKLFARIRESGRHLALMAHFNHATEMAPAVVRQAIARIQGAGATIRLQAPALKHINDQAEQWRALWTQAVNLGCIPYYMFVERDTGPKGYFDLPLVELHRLFIEAYSSVSGLARTVRGPSMSTYWGKIVVEGICTIAGEKAIALKFLQARNTAWVGQLFFARYDSKATWIDELEPLDGGTFFFQTESLVQHDSGLLPLVGSGIGSEATGVGA